MRDGIFIGSAQACALIPGVSRSGATITGGLFLGLDRTSAARYSFLLSFLTTHSTRVFVVYRVVLGTIVLVLATTGTIS